MKEADFPVTVEEPDNEPQRPALAENGFDPRADARSARYAAFDAAAFAVMEMQLENPEEDHGVQHQREGGTGVAPPRARNGSGRHEALLHLVRDPSRSSTSTRSTTTRRTGMGGAIAAAWTAQRA